LIQICFLQQTVPKDKPCNERSRIEIKVPSLIITVFQVLAKERSVFYRVPEDDNCHRMFLQMLAFYMIELLRGTVKEIHSNKPRY